MSDYAVALSKVYTRLDKAREEALDGLFPPGLQASSEGNHFNTPLTIINAEDNILAWYLPDLISHDAHV